MLELGSTESPLKLAPAKRTKYDYKEDDAQEDNTVTLLPTLGFSMAQRNWNFSNATENTLRVNPCQPSQHNNKQKLTVQLRMVNQ